MEKVCKDCGEFIPFDSKFCQYCGSKNIEEYIKPKTIKIFQCFDCKEEIPNNSKFCQYCGSNKVGYIERIIGPKKTIDIIEENKIKCPYCKKEVNENDIFCPHCNRKLGNKDYSNDNSEEKHAHSIIIKIVLIALLFIIVCCGINSCNTANDPSINNENKTNNRIITDRYGNVIGDSFDYNKSYNEVLNQIIYDDFFANKYDVNGINTEIDVYCLIDSAGSISSQSSNEEITCVWSEWEIDNANIPHCKLNIKCPKGQWGVITFTNDYNEHSFMVIVKNIQR